MDPLQSESRWGVRLQDLTFLSQTLFVEQKLIHPITSWEIDGETVETVSEFILGSSKITADGDCSHEIKRPLTPWKESYGQPR